MRWALRMRRDSLGRDAASYLGFPGAAPRRASPFRELNPQQTVLLLLLLLLLTFHMEMAYLHAHYSGQEPEEVLPHLRLVAASAGNKRVISFDWQSSSREQQRAVAAHRHTGRRTEKPKPRIWGNLT